jgi:hypothetical protein
MKKYGLIFLFFGSIIGFAHFNPEPYDAIPCVPELISEAAADAEIAKAFPKDSITGRPLGFDDFVRSFTPASNTPVGPTPKPSPTFKFERVTPLSPGISTSSGHSTPSLLRDELSREFSRQQIIVDLQQSIQDFNIQNKDEDKEIACKNFYYFVFEKIDDLFGSERTSNNCNRCKNEFRELFFDINGLTDIRHQLPAQMSWGTFIMRKWPNLQVLKGIRVQIIIRNLIEIGPVGIE